MADSKLQGTNHQEYIEGYQTDEKGRRFSQQDGQYYDDTGRRFSGYNTAGRRVSVVDDVFGEISEGGPNYRDVGVFGTSVLMMKTQIGLGVLSIPLNFDTLGMIPGVICLLVIGGITTWSDYMVGVFKINHPTVYGIDDVGELIAGKTGRYIMATVFVLCKYIKHKQGLTTTNCP